MSRPIIKIHNVQTGEIIEREYNDEELAQWEKDKADEVARQAAFSQAETRRKAALAKLSALGLEPDDLKALGL